MIVNDPGGGEAPMGFAPVSVFAFETAPQFGQSKGKGVEGLGQSMVNSNGTKHHGLDYQLPDHDMEWDGAPPEYTPRSGWQ